MIPRRPETTVDTEAGRTGKTAFNPPTTNTPTTDQNVRDFNN